MIDTTNTNNNISIKVKSKTLKKALNIIYKISYEHKAVEFSSFFINVEKNTLVFLAMNDALCIEHKIKESEDLKIQGEGKFIVNAFLFNELIQKTNDEITLEIVEKTILIVKTKTYKTKINTIDLDFWREKKMFLEGVKLNLKKEEIKLLINQISYAVQNKEGKKIFQGINFRSINNRIIASATDGSRITRRAFSSIDKDVDLTLPLNSLVEANRIINLEKNENVAIVFGEKGVLFDFDEDTKLYSKVIDDGSDFPDIEKQFIQNFESNIVCSAQQLISAIEKASIFFEKSSLPIVVLKIINNKFFVSSSEKNTSGFFEEEINDAKTEGKEQKISLQAKFVLTTLRSLESNEIIIKFSSSHGPVFFSEYQNPDLKILILPFWLY